MRDSDTICVFIRVSDLCVQLTQPLRLRSETTNLESRSAEIHQYSLTPVLRSALIRMHFDNRLTDLPAHDRRPF